MTQFTNTHDRYDLNTKGDDVREDLADIIINISPTETPFVSMVCGRATASSDLHEWLIDELADVDGSNKHIDGDEFAGEAAVDAARIGNYCQISKKELTVSRRANKVRKAGRKSELAYQLAKKGKELKRDVETIALSNQIGLAGNSTTAPTTAGVPAWLKTNTDRGATGTDPALNNTTYGYPDTAAGDGDLRALSEADILGIIGSIYAEGGNIDTMMVHHTVKQKFSQYQFSTSARIATPYQDHGANNKSGITALGAVDIFVSDLGTVKVMPNRFQRSRDVFIFDSEYWDIAYLDGYKTETIAKTGDAEKRHILVDWAVKSGNEAASGIVADVDATAAMTA